MEIHKKSSKTPLKSFNNKNIRSSQNSEGICQNWSYRKILKKACMHLKDLHCPKKLQGSLLSDQPEKGKQLYHESELQAPHSPKPKSSPSKKFMASKESRISIWQFIPSFELFQSSTGMVLPGGSEQCPSDCTAPKNWTGE